MPVADLFGVGDELGEHPCRKGCIGEGMLGPPPSHRGRTDWDAARQDLHPHECGLLAQVSARKRRAAPCTDGLGSHPRWNENLLAEGRRSNRYVARRAQREGCRPISGRAKR